jgi:hypothetical protein
MAYDASYRSNTIKLSNDQDLGLWATPVLNRVAVSLQRTSPEPIIGYILEIGERMWAAEGDPENQTFDLPRKAAEHGYAFLWRPALEHRLQ